MAYALEGPRWATTTITWDFASSTLPGDITTAFSNVIAQPEAQAVVAAAFEAWSRVADLQFVHAPQDSVGVDIRLGWGTLAASTDTAELGVTTLRYRTPVNQILPDVRIRLLDPTGTPLSDSPGTPTYTTYDATLFQVALHEIGHAIGLAHDVTDAYAIMYPYLDAQNRQLAAPDIAGAQALYGAPRAELIDIGANQETLSGSLSGMPSTVFGGSGALDYTGNVGLIVLANGSARIDDGTVTVFAGSGPLAAADNARATFILGSGSSSIGGGAAGSADILFGGSGAFTYAGQQEAASVIGGTGSATITGGTGGGFYSGGSTGNNLLTAQWVGTVLVGGGNNDVLRAAPIGYDYLVAGAGNETLVGAGGGTDRFFLGSGHDQAQFGAGPGLLVTGAGSATIFAGNGVSTVFGGSGGADLDVVQPGSAMWISGFRVGLDHVGGSPLTAAAVGGGDTVLHFADGAVVTLNGVSDPSASGLLG
ncbi:matrixin family metalloprotease [Lichenicoccus sp.]|uniref:matrixin family metalloprotease n=1 Tax=Lichenicoccus sp. TaxID=2781899 RepID=UPI003D0FDF0D